MQTPIPIYTFPQLSSTQHLGDFKIYQFKAQTEQYSDLSSIPVKTDIPHRHSFFEVFIFWKGAGNHMIDFHTFDVKSPSIHFISPGQVHLLNSREAFHGYVMVFSEQLWGARESEQFPLLNMPFFSPLCKKPITELREKDTVYIKNIIHQILFTCQEETKYRLEMIRSYLKIFLLYCSHIYEEAEPKQLGEENRSKTLTAKYKMLMEEHFRSEHQVQHYAEQLAITPDHLNKVCKSTTGQKAGELLLGRIILEAKRLLLYSDMSQKEVAYHLGFKDPSYFSRIFRRKTDQTPSVFRKQMQEKYH